MVTLLKGTVPAPATIITDTMISNKNLFVNNFFEIHHRFFKRLLNIIGFAIFK